MTLWTGAHQAPLSTEFSRQEYWSKLLFILQSPLILNSELKKVTGFLLLAAVKSRLTAFNLGQRIKMKVSSQPHQIY